MGSLLEALEDMALKKDRISTHNRDRQVPNILSIPEFFYS
jgi:hypothetical protein